MEGGAPLQVLQLIWTHFINVRDLLVLGVCVRTDSQLLPRHILEQYCICKIGQVVASNVNQICNH